jgi:uncharacterized DUF497 family protein
MLIEWDEKKAASNYLKHKISFEEAAIALTDPLSVTSPDPDHSISESRYITIGASEFGRLIIVAHSERGAVLRIISARLATKAERRIYAEI